MRLSIMQPYFLPYLGYFSLIAATDHFVVFDQIQYIRHGWINRNRILKPGFSDAQYITLPLAKHSKATLIRDIAISEHNDWKGRILGQIQHYKKKAPYYKQAREILDRCFEMETTSIVEFNIHCLETVCNAIEMRFSYSYCHDLEIEPVNHAGEWALNISSALNAKAYVNPEGGREIFEASQFKERGIDLLFLENSLTAYSQRNQQFVAGLSILDVLMFNSLDETRQRIREHTVVAA